MQPSPNRPGLLTRTEITYAGFWLRLLAYLIDSTLLYAVSLAIVMGPLYDTVKTFSILSAAAAASGVVSVQGVLHLAGNIQALINAAAVAALIGWAYYAILESSPARGTLGKLALGLYVGDTHGDPIGFFRATMRYLLKGLSSVFLDLGWLMAAFTPRKQALHDLLAGTLVLRKVSYIVIGEEPPSEPGDYWDGTRWVASVPPPPLSLENT